VQRRLIVVLAALVVFPLAVVGVLATHVARSEQRLVRERFTSLLEARLRDLDDRVQQTLEQTSLRLLALTRDLDLDPDRLRRLARTTPEIDQLFVQRRDGLIVHPSLADPLSEHERQFLRRFAHVLDSQELWHAADQGDAGQQAAKLQRAAAEPRGWRTAHWEAGLHLLLWRRDPRGYLVGLELNRPRLVSDLIVELNPAGSSAGEPGTITLVDSRGRVLWMRGPPPDPSLSPDVEIFASPPLGSWRWRYHQAAAPARSSATILAAVAGFSAMAVAVVSLAAYLYRESTRDLREAAQRVRFVNQVSHELRTPLTNIRLYAELLEQRLGDDDHRARDQLRVIVSESHRLSRLIGNVLSFARQRRGQLHLTPCRAVLDEVVVRVVEQFRPLLGARGLAILTELRAPQPFAFDPDGIEQVLANLLANVEKYASSGERVSVSTRQEPGWTVLEVVDDGPGIPTEQWQAVFEPFVRLSDRLTEGSAGAGMGLAISRDIARLHGGELRLLPADQGARFELRLPHPEAP
jgi:signal transduction histidine kinase